MDNLSTVLRYDFCKEFHGLILAVTGAFLDSTLSFRCSLCSVVTSNCPDSNATAPYLASYLQNKAMNLADIRCPLRLVKKANGA